MSKERRQRNPEKIRERERLAGRARYQKDREKRIEIGNRWKLVHPEQWRMVNRARMSVHRAVKKGVLVRGTSCEACGRGDCKIEASHQDYSKPLEVTWLCVSCHRRRDAVDPRSAS